MRSAAIVLNEAHGKIDGRMIRHVHKQNLRCADDQRGFDARRLRRHAAIKERAEDMADRSEPPQCRRDDVANQCAVTLGERADAEHRLPVFKLLVERTIAAQDAVKNIRSNASGREARRFGFHRMTGTRHTVGNVLEEMRTSGEPTCRSQSRQIKGVISAFDEFLAAATLIPTGRG